MKEMRHRFIKGKKAFLDQSFQRKRDFWTIRNLRVLVRLKAHYHVHRDAARFFRDPLLVQAFSFQTLYIGGNPKRTPALYSLVPFAEHEFGIWYFKGGYAGLITKIREELDRRGVSIRCGVKIEQVLIEQGRCVGVVAEGENLAFDQVVLNGDFPSTLSLLPHDKAGKARSGMAARRPQANKLFVPSSGCLILFMGVNRLYDEQPIHQFLFSANFDRMLHQVFTDKQLPEDPSIYIFNPSIVDQSLAPEGSSSIYMLIPVPSNIPLDQSKLDDYVQGVLKRVEEEVMPELRSSIQWIKVRTPEDAEKEGLYRGGSFGIAPELRQSGVFRPQLSPYGVDHLYAVGASVHPGGGVPIVMQSAKLLAEYLLDRKTSRVSLD
jgi:phytoene desaturase